ncbi:MAG: hypothetical protein ACO3A4_08660 [Silvanigrellaceae bacterium]
MRALARTRISLMLSCGSTLLMLACGNRNDSLDQSSSVSSPQSSASAKGFAIIDEQITQTIAERMTAKCAELKFEKSSDLEGCSAASATLAAELDFSYIRRNDGNSAFVFFSKKLHALMADPQVGTYLNDLQIACLDAIYSGKTFNLWDFTLAKSGGRSEVALERIAVLFQDGSQTAAQKKFLLVEQHPMAFVLGQTLDLLDQGLERGQIEAYPKPIQLSRTAHYHYYVPRFLAQQLSRKSHSQKMSALVPFVFNSVYELRQIQKAQNSGLPAFHKAVTVDRDENPALKELVAKWNRFDELYSDLLDHLSAPLIGFTPQGQKENLEDLFLGYLGGRDGSRGGGNMTLDEFVADFAKDPVLFFKSK